MRRPRLAALLCASLAGALVPVIAEPPLARADLCLLVLCVGPEGEEGGSGAGTTTSTSTSTTTTIGPPPAGSLADPDPIPVPVDLGVITTVAGNGDAGDSGDGGSAAAAALGAPLDAVPDPLAGFSVAADRLRRIDASGTIAPLAAARARALAPLPGGGLLVADPAGHRVLRVAPAGAVTVAAGTGSPGSRGDGGLATAARLRAPEGVVATGDGGFLVADTGNHTVRRVRPDGTITRVVGTGAPGAPANGAAALDSPLSAPVDLAVAADGAILVADAGAHAILRVAPDGRVTRVAGTGTAGAGPDGGPATAAALDGPRGVAVLADGGLLIADTGNHRIRRVVPTGSVATIAGTGEAGFAGDLGPADAARLDRPHDVAVGPTGQLLVADAGNRRVRAVVTALRGATPPAGVPQPEATDPPPPAPGSGGPGAATPAPDEPAEAALPPGPPLPALAAPVPGRRLAAAPVAGAVRVRMPGRSAWSSLVTAASVPVGSLVDTRQGAIRLVTVRGADGRVQAATFAGGLFRVRQRAVRRPPTVLELAGGDFRGCPRAAGTARAARRRRGRRETVRRVFGDGHGRFVTRGRHGAATVRGTVWELSDRCDGTVVRVHRGAVDARAHGAPRAVRVRPGAAVVLRRAR